MSRSTILPPGRVTIVGVLNATPDSFSDGGRFGQVGASRSAPLRSGWSLDVARAVRAAHAMVEEGADWIDVGGESTRPGARAVDAEEEIRRTRPLVEALAKELSVPISIDTRKAVVARAALDAGAQIVNDVSGLRDPALAERVAEHGAGLVIGHLRGEPATMQQGIAFADVVAEVSRELGAAARTALQAGVERERIAVDPGLGFGKQPEHSLRLLARVGEIEAATGFPVLLGPSRKSFLGGLTGEAPSERDTVTHAACAVAVFAGARGVRVHDVAGARRAVLVATALRAAREAGG